MKLIAVFIVALALQGCALFTENPNNATAFTSDQIVAMAKQVERAQASGVLSEDAGDEYLTMLLRANQLLEGSTSVYSDISACESSTSQYECIDAILATVQGELQ